jgi:GntR family transcriptional regulator/MocR family aminotransferase
MATSSQRANTTSTFGACETAIAAGATRWRERLRPFDVRISELSAGLRLLLLLPDCTEHAVLRRAGEAGIALSGRSRLRHPLASEDVPDADGVVVNFGAPAEHAFGAAIDAFCEVLAGLK